MKHPISTKTNCLKEKKPHFFWHNPFNTNPLLSVITASSTIFVLPRQPSTSLLLSITFLSSTSLLMSSILIRTSPSCHSSAWRRLSLLCHAFPWWCPQPWCYPSNWCSALPWCGSPLHDIHLYDVNQHVHYLKKTERNTMLLMGRNPKDYLIKNTLGVK